MKLVIKKIKLLPVFTLTLVFVIGQSCTEFIEIDPPLTEVLTEAVFENDETAISAIRGMYSEMMLSGSIADGGFGSITVIAGLSSDEMLAFTSTNSDIQLNSNNLTPENGRILNSWRELYRIIYFANSFIKGLNNSTGVSDLVRNQLEGEARFIRAFYYFYLVNLFGEVPLITSTDFSVNTSSRRTPESKVYEQITDDLLLAKELLAKDYSFSKGERVQPNYFAATALLARVYLYLNDWSNAEVQSSEIIDSELYSLEDNLDNVFRKNSAEAIWQLKPVIPGNNTNEAQVLINPPGMTPKKFVLTDGFMKAIEVGDNRECWIDTVTDASAELYYQVYKYKVNEVNQPLTEYYMLMRLAEQYLIRAEARAQLHELTGSMRDMDKIRGRAGLHGIEQTNPGTSQSDLLLAIEQERRIEFFVEWGHRWLDLKRTNKANDVMLDLPLKDWQPTDILYPIPQSEMESNVNITQNDGY